MKYLVIKDIKILRFVHLFMIIWGIGAGIIGTFVDNIIISKMVYGYGTILMIYIFSMMLSQYNIKTKTDIIINSFPVTRANVVRAKYIVTILYMVFSVGVVFISSNIAIRIFGNRFLGKPATTFDMVFIIGLSLIVFSFYLVFEYYNIGKIAAYNQLFLILLASGPSLLSKYGPKIENVKWINKLAKMDLKSITFILVGFGLILYIISLQISKQIYKAKEF